jgi:50S ribosomal protein L16 3-hydroxylase|tara:strand:- start:13232 stop:14404 length:1173 start_codon:yes stop_codon:yes gene_type:complete
MAEFFNTGLTEQQFLDEYWQKKPLLIRQAFPDFQSPISADDLIELAAEEEIESRLIVENEKSGDWSLRSEGLSNQDFKDLPASHWTVLVQDLDKHLPEMQSVIDPFRFLPDWRHDDLMASYAAKFGSVGAHTDSYDVFLLQAMGSRRWQLSDQPLFQPELIAGLDLKILKAFAPDQSWDLVAGDMLYVPPHFAHHGVALNDCITFSIGFRAPSKVDVLDALTNSLLDAELGRDRYSDPDLIVAEHTHEISQQAVTEVKKLLHNAIDEADPVIASALGRLLTDTKNSLIELAEDQCSELPIAADLNAHFEAGDVLERNLYYRFAWTKSHQGAQLFCAAEAYALNDYEHAMLLTEKALLTADEWALLSLDTQSTTILCELIAEGAWFWQTAS